MKPTTQQTRKLPREEQIRLHKLWLDEQDVVARNKLAISYYGWCRIIAQNFASSQKELHFEEVLQLAFLGLLKAIDKWEPEKGTLSTYAAWWMRHKCSRALMYDRRKGLSGLVPPNAQHFSMYTPDDDEGGSYAEETVHTPEIVYGETIKPKFNQVITDRVALRKALMHLPPVECTVITQRLRNYSNAEIGAQLSITKQRVEQLERQALRRLRMYFGLSAHGALSLTKVEPKTVPKIERGIQGIDVIYNWVKDHPNCTTMDISHGVSMHDQAVRRLLMHLKEEGLIESEHGGTSATTHLSLKRKALLVHRAVA